MKVFISSFLRKLGLLYFSDKLRYLYILFKTSRERKEFREKYPNIILPPNYLIYESYRLNYSKYYFDGKESAQWLINNLSKHTSFNKIKILDWGCGPARIVRHLPELLNYNCDIYGTDYNEQSINWCKKNIENVNFNCNNLDAVLNYPDNYFDVIYGISIFTHLSEKLHYSWFNELLRITKRDGILFFTTQGKAFVSKLTLQEQNTFLAGQVVEKGNTKEGHRTYSAFQPFDFFSKIIDKNEIVEFVEGKLINGQPEQDVWIIKKL